VGSYCISHSVFIVVTPQAHMTRALGVDDCRDVVGFKRAILADGARRSS
jgi:hypothetical protein